MSNKEGERESDTDERKVGNKLKEGEEKEWRPLLQPHCQSLCE